MSGFMSSGSDTRILYVLLIFSGRGNVRCYNAHSVVTQCSDPLRSVLGLQYRKAVCLLLCDIPPRSVCTFCEFALDDKACIKFVIHFVYSVHFLKV